MRTNTPPRANIGAVVVPTCDRPQVLARALKSAISHLSFYGRTPDITVCDASTNQRHETANASLIKKAARSYSGRIWLVGRRERRNLAAALSAESGIDRRVIDFGLFGVAGCAEAPGANRNGILLTHMGEAILSTDDDVLWRPARPRHAAPPGSYRVQGDEVLRDVLVCSNREGALSGVTRVGECLLDHHERVLAGNISQLLSSSLSAEEFRPCSHLRASLEQGRATVVMSFSGVYGDSGMHTPYRALLSRTEPSFADSTCGSREIVSAPPSVSLSHAGPWMATACGLDNRGRIPLYFPVGRNEDGIAGAILHRCDAHAYFAHLPLSVLHSPPHPRSYSPTWTSSVASPRISDAILCAVWSYDDHGSPQEAPAQIAGLGAHLRTLARMPLPDLYRFLGERWNRVIQARAVELGQRLRTMFGASDARWAVAEHCLRTFRMYLLSGRAARDIETVAPSRVGVATLLDFFGQLLGASEGLLKAARKINDRYRHPVA